MKPLDPDRKSIELRLLKNEIRSEALNQKDEKLQKKLWRWFYRAKDAEYEVDILVQKSDVRNLLKLAFAQRWFDATQLLDFDDHTDDDEDNNVPPPPPPEEKKRKSKKKPPPDDDDNLPRQMGLWNDEE
jgi:hypothetical protein